MMDFGDHFIVRSALAGMVSPTLAGEGPGGRNCRAAGLGASPKEEGEPTLGGAP
jgi:hypothetical protein